MTEKQEPKTRKRSYIILQQETLDNGSVAYFEVTRADGVTNKQALREGYRKLLEVGCVAGSETFVAVSEKSWKPVKVKTATKQQVAITVG